MQGRFCGLNVSISPTGNVYNYNRASSIFGFSILKRTTPYHYNVQLKPHTSESQFSTFARDTRSNTTTTTTTTTRGTNLIKQTQRTSPYHFFPTTFIFSQSNHYSTARKGSSKGGSKPKTGGGGGGGSGGGGSVGATKSTKQSSKTKGNVRPSSSSTRAAGRSRIEYNNMTEEERAMSEQLNAILSQLPRKDQEKVVKILEKDADAFTDEELHYLVGLGLVDTSEEGVKYLMENQDSIESDPRFAMNHLEKYPPQMRPHIQRKEEEAAKAMMMRKQKSLSSGREEEREDENEEDDEEDFDEIEALIQRDKEIEEEAKAKGITLPPNPYPLPSTSQKKGKKGEKKSSSSWEAAFQDLKKSQSAIGGGGASSIEDLIKMQITLDPGNLVTKSEVEGEDEFESASIQELMEETMAQSGNAAYATKSMRDEEEEDEEEGDEEGEEDEEEDETIEEIEDEAEMKRRMAQNVDSREMLIDRPSKQKKEKPERSKEEVQRKRKERIDRRKYLIRYNIGDIILPQSLRDKILNMMDKLTKQLQSTAHSITVSNVVLPESPIDHVYDHLVEDIRKDEEKDSIKKETNNEPQSRLVRKSTLINHLRNKLYQLYNASVDEARDIVSGIKEVERPAITYSLPESIVYSYFYMPGAYACLYRIYHEVTCKLPDFYPKNMLDFGSGPGTAHLSAFEYFGPYSFQKVLSVEPSSNMLNVQQRLISKNVSHVFTYRRYLSQGLDAEAYDLVVSSSTLSSIFDNRERRSVIRSLWRHVAPGGVLIISENGSPLGFEIVREARSILINEVIHPGVLIAPCPHMEECPIINSWCHFKQRVQTLVKTEINYLDVPYSYVAFQKQAAVAVGDDDAAEEGKEEVETPRESHSKILLMPKKKTGHIRLVLCTPSGQLEELIVAKSTGKAYYTSARKAKAGDSFNDRKIEEMRFSIQQPLVVVKPRKKKKKKKEENTDPSESVKIDKQQLSSMQKMSPKSKVQTGESAEDVVLVSHSTKDFAKKDKKKAAIAKLKRIKSKQKKQTNPSFNKPQKPKK